MLAAALAAGVVSGVGISPVPEGKMAAFSFTYDDGVRSHYTAALPLHLKYGMPGTFFIITDRVEADGPDRAGKYCSFRGDGDGEEGHGDGLAHQDPPQHART